MGPGPERSALPADAAPGAGMGSNQSSQVCRVVPGFSPRPPLTPVMARRDGVQPPGAASPE